jgi:hypothetical protein
VQLGTFGGYLITATLDGSVVYVDTADCAPGREAGGLHVALPSAPMDTLMRAWSAHQDGAAFGDLITTEAEAHLKHEVQYAIIEAEQHLRNQSHENGAP